MTIKDYWDELSKFLAEKCAGPEYDSCHNSPCPYSSSAGCTHQDHPIHRFKQFQEVAR